VVALSDDYAAVIHEGYTIPDHIAEIPYTIRQPGATIIKREHSMQFQSSDQNDHLAVTDEYFEAEVSEFGSDEKQLIKVIRDDEGDTR